MNEMEILRWLKKLEEQTEYLLRLEKLGPHAETHLPGGSDPVDSSELAWSRAISMYLALPGLRGFWPMSSVDEAGRAIDISGQARHLSFFGGVNFAFESLGLIPACYNGAAQHMYRADEAGLDITGSEPGINSLGLTCGGWFCTSNFLASSTYMMRKIPSDGLAYPPYSLWHWTDGVNKLFSFDVSQTGAARTFIVLTNPVANLQWYFAVGRYKPSHSLKLFVNDQSATLASGVPASIYASTSELRINEVPNVAGMYQFSSLVFLCAAALPDATIQALYQQTRHLFGV